MSINWPLVNEIETMKSKMRTYELKYGVEVESYRQECDQIEKWFSDYGLLIGFDESSDVVVYLAVNERVEWR